jgi:hypothetical protein
VDGDRWSVAALLIIYTGMRIVDAILPDGHHWRRMDRFLKRDNNNKEPDDEP